MAGIFDRNGVFAGYDREKLDVIRKAVADKGLEWVIAALVDGSIGYHTYHSAKNLIESVLANEFTSCERTSACFNGDASAEILADIRYFEALEKRNPERVKRVVEFTRKMANLDTIQSWTLSAMYPTIKWNI
jgi:hypothetical protein